MPDRSRRSLCDSIEGLSAARDGLTPNLRRSPRCDGFGVGFSHDRRRGGRQRRPVVHRAVYGVSRSRYPLFRPLLQAPPRCSSIRVPKSHRIALSSSQTAFRSIVSEHSLTHRDTMRPALLTLFAAATLAVAVPQESPELTKWTQQIIEAQRKGLPPPPPPGASTSRRHDLGQATPVVAPGQQLSPALVKWIEEVTIAQKKGLPLPPKPDAFSQKSRSGTLNAQLDAFERELANLSPELTEGIDLKQIETLGRATLESRAEDVSIDERIKADLPGLQKRQVRIRPRVRRVGVPVGNVAVRRRAGAAVRVRPNGVTRVTVRPLVKRQVPGTEAGAAVNAQQTRRPRRNRNRAGAGAGAGADAGAGAAAGAGAGAAAGAGPLGALQNILGGLLGGQRRQRGNGQRRPNAGANAAADGAGAGGGAGPTKVFRPDAAPSTGAASAGTSAARSTGQPRVQEIKSAAPKVVSGQELPEKGEKGASAPAAKAKIVNGLEQAEKGERGAPAPAAKASTPAAKSTTPAPAPAPAAATPQAAPAEAEAAATPAAAPPAATTAAAADAQTPAAAPKPIVPADLAPPESPTPAPATRSSVAETLARATNEGAAFSAKQGQVVEVATPSAEIQVIAAAA